MLYSKRHPQRDTPVIDYNAAIVLQPMLLLGTTLGVILNRIFPEWLILLLLTLTLILTTYKTLLKG